MKPSYYKLDMGEDFDSELQKEVLRLRWVEQRSARREYFMSFIPRTYSYGNKTRSNTLVGTQTTSQAWMRQSLLLLFL